MQLRTLQTVQNDSRRDITTQNAQMSASVQVVTTDDAVKICFIQMISLVLEQYFMGIVWKLIKIVFVCIWFYFNKSLYARSQLNEHVSNDHLIRCNEFQSTGQHGSYLDN